MKIVSCILIASIVGIEIVSMISNRKKVKLRRIEKVYTGEFLGIEFKKQTLTLSTDPVFYNGKDRVNIPKGWKLFYYEDEGRGKIKYILCEPYILSGSKNLSEGTQILVEYEGSENLYLRQISGSNSRIPVGCEGSEDLYLQLILDKSVNDTRYICDNRIKYIVRFEEIV